MHEDHADLDALRAPFLERDDGDPLVLTVAAPLRPASQRLMDFLGVEVHVVTATRASEVTRCQHEHCAWNFVGSDEKARPYLAAHLLLMHAGRQSLEPAPARDVTSPEPQPEPRSARGGPVKQWTKEAIIEALQRWNEQHGAPPTSTIWQKKADGYPTTSTVVGTFGAWSDALVAAGFEARSRGAQPGNANKAGHTKQQGQQPPIVWVVKVPGTGLRYSTVDEALDAADEIEHDGERVAIDARVNGQEGKADQALDASRELAEKIRAATRAIDNDLPALPEREPNASETGDLPLGQTPPPDLTTDGVLGDAAAADAHDAEPPSRSGNADVLEAPPSLLRAAVHAAVDAFFDTLEETG